MYLLTARELAESSSLANVSRLETLSANANLQCRTAALASSLNRDTNCGRRRERACEISRALLVSTRHKSYSVGDRLPPLIEG